LVAIPLGFVLHTTQLRAGVVLILWFGLQLLSNLFTAPGSGGVAFAAHVGGFLFGALAVRAFQVRAPLRPRW
jgi:membrane associated rhomboid family serine protease